MARYVKIPIEVDAVQWHKEGDHPKVMVWKPLSGMGERSCNHCGRLLKDHGGLVLKMEFVKVCPRDWIITLEDGTVYPRKDSLFKNYYREV